MSVPAPAVPAGQPTNADRAWAADYLSAVLGRAVSGGLNVDRLALRLAQERAGHDEAAIPAPRPAWRDLPVRGGARR